MVVLEAGGGLEAEKDDAARELRLPGGHDVVAEDHLMRAVMWEKRG